MSGSLSQHDTTFMDLAVQVSAMAWTASASCTSIMYGTSSSQSLSSSLELPPLLPELLLLLPELFRLLIVELQSSGTSSGLSSRAAGGLDDTLTLLKHLFKDKDRDFLAKLGCLSFVNGHQSIFVFL